MLLGVNIDHVATVRQARKAAEPDPVSAAVLATLGGADSIVVHLREDRRHVQDRDLEILRRTLQVPLNLEMGLSPEIRRIALRVRPDRVTFVPEKRQELTTEGGLDAARDLARVRAAVRAFHRRGVEVSLFVDPDPRQAQAARAAGADIVEFHTGAYANAPAARRPRELRRLVQAVRAARSLGLRAAAGHGLTYHNVRPVAAVGGVFELNIGHSIVARAVLVGIERAVREMKALVDPPGADGPAREP